MSTKFTRSHVGSQLTIGEQLREARRSKRLSLLQVEKRLKIQEHHLEAFEADRFDLPDLYLRGLLTSYAELLGLDPQKLLRPIFAKRRLEAVRHAPVKRARPLRVRTVVTPKRLSWTFGVLAVALALPLLGREFAVWAKPSEISFDPVYTDERTGEVTLKGHLDPESRLWAKGIEVGVSDDGSFSLHLLLPTGPNRLDFVTKNRFGKSTTSSKVLSVYPPQPTSSTAPVALRLEVTDRPAWVSVRSGAEKLFDGLMLPGAAQTFYGSDLTVSTSDGGATAASVSNSMVQRKDLGPLGRAHERIQNLRIQPDTVIQ